MAIMYAQLSEPPPAVTSRRAGIPAEVDGVFATALAKAPADRYPSCTDFAEALREAFGIRPYDSSPGSVPSGPHPATRLVSSSGPEDAGAVGAGTVAAAAAGGRPGHPGTEAVDPGAVDPGGPRTVLAGRDDRRDTSPDLTAEHWEGGGGLSRRRPGWRSPGAIAAGIVLILVLAGGGFLAFHHNHGKDVSYLPSLALPGCTTRTAPGRTLSVANQLVTIDPSGDNPFGLQVSRDGKFVFAVTPTTVQVLAKGPGLALTPKYTYTIATAAMPANGATMTSDGKYLLVAAGAGIDVLSVADGEAGASSMNVGTLLVPNAPGNSGAVEVAVSPGNQFAFVTLKSRNVLAVFNLGRAIATGTFLSSTYVGSVQLGASPVGMALSPNGHWMYVTSYHNGDATGTGEGLLNVLNVAKAETDPAASVVAQVDAGCQPARVIVSPDGMTVWVTARGSNAVLGFSAALAAAGSRRALIAKVQVGQTPIGLALVDGGSRLVVADADVRNTSSAAHNLAVVNVAAALARGPALLGYIPSGALPREFATVPGGRYLLVSDNGSAQVQVVDVSKLP
jgi:DNA-binding beta-propeller fold protein YncE